MACDGEADGAAGPFISRCCDLYGALRLDRVVKGLCLSGRLRGWPTGRDRVKHPRVYSKIARRPNGSLRSRLCRWFSTYCIQLVVWRATLWMDGSDGMLLHKLVCSVSYAGAEHLVLYLYQCYDADLGAIGNKLHGMPKVSKVCLRCVYGYVCAPG
ncbi:hypothetical protein J3F84DRAFT_195559 [Trichoderma pleuroticola]